MIAGTPAIHFPNFAAPILADKFGRIWTDRFAALIDPRAAGAMQRPDANLDLVRTVTLWACDHHSPLYRREYSAEIAARAAA